MGGKFELVIINSSNKNIIIRANSVFIGKSDILNGSTIIPSKNVRRYKFKEGKEKYLSGRITFQITEEILPELYFNVLFTNLNDKWSIDTLPEKGCLKPFYKKYDLDYSTYESRGTMSMAVELSPFNYKK